MGRTITIKYTNKYNLPQAILDAILANEYDASHGTLSATSLINAPKYSLLKARHWDEIESDIVDNIWQLFGKAVHNVFDKHTKEGIRKRRLYATINGLTISGEPDLINGQLDDYKVTSVWNIIFGDNTWKQQLNIYKYLCDVNGLKVDSMRIIAILRDWQKNKAKADWDYPQLPVRIVNIEPMKDIGKYLEARVGLYKLCMGALDDDIPPCDGKERWATADTWAVCKIGIKKAVKVFPNESEAARYFALISKNPVIKYEIIYRPGEDKRCTGYCPVNKFCNFYKNKYKSDKTNGGDKK